MTQNKETFASRFKRFEYRYDPRTVFDDFLTLTLAAFSQNPRTGKSHDEELYLATIAKYAKDDLRFQFPLLLGDLAHEMTERMESDTGYDVLGEYYESNFSRKGASQFFTPWPICKFMAQSTYGESQKETTDRPLRILEPACGSGRMLLAFAQAAGRHHEYYAIDIDHTCVKMTAVNLFLSGLFHSEAMCADALVPEDFNGSYRTSFLPFGVFRITDKQRSPLWHCMQRDVCVKKESTGVPEDYKWNEKKYPDGSQLTMF